MAKTIRIGGIRTLPAAVEVSPPAPSVGSDLQHRLAAIEARADGVVRTTTDDEKRSLAYDLGYVAKLLRQHLRTGER